MIRKVATKALIAALLIAASLVVVAFALQGKRVEIVITDRQIKQKLGEKLPVEKTYSLDISESWPVSFEMTYSNPRVVLIDGRDRATVGLDASVSIKIGRSRRQLGPFHGSCNVSFGLDFRPTTGEFFLVDCRIEGISVEGVPARYTEIISQFGSIGAKEVLDRVPVYTLTAKDTKTAIAKLVLKNVTVRDGALVVTLGL